MATTPKPAAQVLLWANPTDPLLAAWQYGLGRVAAFTSDATGRWAKAWVPWEDFPKFWAQVIRWTILERPDTAVQARVIQRGDQTLIQAELPVDDGQSEATLQATLIDSEGNSRQVPLAQTAPGQYEVETFLDQPGAYFVRIESADGVTGTKPIEKTLAWVKPYSPEYTPSPSARDTLNAWAELGGGELIDSPAQAFARNAPVAATRSDLFPLLLALSALLLPFDIGVRRITVSFRKLAGRIRAREFAPATLEQTGRMVQLMRAKTRSTQTAAIDRPQPSTLRDRPAATGAASATRSAQVPAAGIEPSPSPPSPSASASAAELLRRRRKAPDGNESPGKPGGAPNA